MSDGGAYANVHTDKYPKGAIRGQISSTSGSMEASTSENTTSTSGSMEGGDTTTTQSTSDMSQSTDSPDMDVDESMK